MLDPSEGSLIDDLLAGKTDSSRMMICAFVSLEDLRASSCLFLFWVFHERYTFSCRAFRTQLTDYFKAFGARNSSSSSKSCVSLLSATQYSVPHLSISFAQVRWEISPQTFRTGDLGGSSVKMGISPFLKNLVLHEECPMGDT
ncbi:15962_t:CDS:2 [Funneliformis geosporum]|nr:15962_t:CDS:2 [Funneliformis geosporum]